MAVIDNLPFVQVTLPSQAAHTLIDPLSCQAVVWKTSGTIREAGDQLGLSREGSVPIEFQGPRIIAGLDLRGSAARTQQDDEHGKRNQDLDTHASLR